MALVVQMDLTIYKNIVALHNVRHFLKKNPILSLYLSIPPYYEQNVIGTNLRPTLEHCILFCVSHVHLWLEWF